MKFIKDYPIGDIAPAPYNPRSITPEAFERLKSSIKEFGVVKPLIINTNGNIVAGHQRSRALKALGITHAPVYKSTVPITYDQEIRFNLVHNQLEADKAPIQIDNKDTPLHSFFEISHDKIRFTGLAQMTYVSEYCKLLLKYGECGNVVIDENGAVIHNGEYAYSCVLMRKPCLVWQIRNDERESFIRYLKNDYGSYDFSRIKTHNYAQTYAQMHRSEETFESRLYKRIIFPKVNRSQKILDFGSGEGFGVHKLQKQGFTAYEYEPFRRKRSESVFNVPEIKQMIANVTATVKESGLFDVVILDSVLNSVKDSEWQDYVLTTVNSLLKESGILYLATRSRVALKTGPSRKYACDRAETARAGFYCVDKDGYSLTFRNSVWFKQKFYDADELHAFLSRYFDDVNVEIFNNMLHAECRAKKRLSQEKYRQALISEFNIEYPNNQRLNVHEELVDAILRLN